MARLLYWLLLGTGSLTEEQEHNKSYADMVLARQRRASLYLWIIDIIIVSWIVVCHFHK